MYVYVFVRICMYLYVFVRICMYLYVFLRICMYLYVFVRICMYLYVFVCICMYLYVFVCICILYVFVCVYVYMDHPPTSLGYNHYTLKWGGMGETKTLCILGYLGKPGSGTKYSGMWSTDLKSFAKAATEPFHKGQKNTQKIEAWRAGTNPNIDPTNWCFST